MKRVCSISTIFYILQKRDTSSEGIKRPREMLGKNEETKYDPHTQYKFISWNVNGVNAFSKKDDGSWVTKIVEQERPTCILIQETKLSTKKQEKALKDLFPGYVGHFNTSKLKGKSGTAVFIRSGIDHAPTVSVGLGLEKHDNEGRTMTLEFSDLYVVNNYVPNSGSKLARLDYRVDEWDKDLQKYIKRLEKDKPVIWAGDLNCAVLDIDVHNPKTQKSAGFTPRERKSFSSFLRTNRMVDTYRSINPDTEGKFTYWGYRFNARAKNKGWRLDYFIVSNSLAERVGDSYILDKYLGSDHCPIGLIIDRE